MARPDLTRRRSEFNAGDSWISRRDVALSVVSRVRAGRSNVASSSMILAIYRLNGLQTRKVVRYLSDPIWVGRLQVRDYT
jgi:hypothetical protein